jgi:hypothetical protein
VKKENLRNRSKEPKTKARKNTPITPKRSRETDRYKSSQAVMWCGFDENL